MYTTSKEILKAAQAGHYAVPAFDCVSDVLVRAILDCAEEQRSPVLLMALEHDLAGKGMLYISGLIRAVAPAYEVPVALHLDHATDIDQVKRALDHGFTSVMFDGSTLPLDDNIRITRQVVELAARYGASTEAELGRVAGKELDGGDTGESVLTAPEDVARFVAETGVDSLAVSIGTAHGIYTSLPNLHLDRLSEIRAASDVPLVLHGGSGTPEDQLQEAIRRGITKINIYADLRIAMGAAFAATAADVKRPDPLPDELFAGMHAAIKATVARKIAVCMSARRV
ncbi:D-tagatose-1,6-bisphosphate aldolase subunit KbaY [uncultured Alphaproteobacteria bacterium]|uniref:D-tagatose-1,6-bisphosphate aldolase subunit KbaY n=1 Tax=uncultured Alphaproteobacteria bacterium TaxID=91750 RepID=A0A212JHM0_9PROT|nr:D-tagatose-1,6-bisphosphate aldolase subunit KbaY [uncultured Alphaproteobacteria bacterium]